MEKIQLLNQQKKCSTFYCFCHPQSAQPFTGLKIKGGLSLVTARVRPPLIFAPKILLPGSNRSRLSLGLPRDKREG